MAASDPATASPTRPASPARSGAFTGALAALAGAVAAGRRRRAERRALHAALRVLAARCPRWTASGFDAALLARPGGAEALAARDPVALARLWTTRFRYRDERRRARDVRRLEPVAALLLELLEGEEARLELPPVGEGRDR